MDIGNTLKIDIDQYWTGQGDITIGANTYLSNPGVIGFSSVTLQSGQGVKKTRASIRALKVSILNKYLQDVGPVDVEIKWIYRLGIASSWQFIPYVFRGSLDGYQIENGELRFEIQTLLDDIRQNPPKYWSHEDQIAEYPLDKGMEYLRILADKGIETGWPG